MRRVLTVGLFVMAMLVPGIGRAAQGDRLTVTYDFYVFSDEVRDGMDVGQACAIVDSNGDIATVIISGVDIARTDTFDSPTLRNGEVIDRDGVLKCRVHLTGEIGRDDRYRLSIDGLGAFSSSEYETTESLAFLTGGDRAITVQGEAVALSPYGSRFAPYLPTASTALMVHARPEGDALAEPESMYFSVFGFADEDAALGEFDHVTEWAVSRADGGIAIIDSRFREVSIGALGMDRHAYLKAIDDTEEIVVVIRTGASILVVEGFSSSPGVATFVAEFLGSFLPGSDGSPESVIPEIHELPIGWTLTPSETPIDLIPYTSVEDPLAATPVATPAQ